MIFFESLTNRFSFGKYRGRTLVDVIEDHPKYFYWCINNIDFFSQKVIGQIWRVFPDFVIHINFENHILESEDYDDNWDSDDEESFYCRGETYDNYHGTYAQDVAGWSDQNIEDVLERDPDAYWNID